MITQQQREKLLKLADGYIEGNITAQQMEDLDVWIREDAEVRKVFVAYLHDHAALYWRHVSPFKLENIEELGYGVEGGAERTQSKTSRRVKHKPWWILSGVAGTAALLAVILLWPVLFKAPADTVARIFKVPAESSLEKGDSYVKGESLLMEKGEAEFIFEKTGVHVIAMAPFEIEFGGKDWMRLKKGSLKLTVPEQGVGFVVKTRDCLVTDLGTQFVVSAMDEGTRVLVFEGEVIVEEEAGYKKVQLTRSETGLFKKGKPSEVVKRDNLSRGKDSPLPELSQPLGDNSHRALKGRIFTKPRAASTSKKASEKAPLSHAFHELVRSGFKNDKQVNRLIEGSELRFGGIAGHYYGYALRNRLPLYKIKNGWMAWYSGQVMAPEAGRYRFWGRADNQLLISIEGKPVFEGSIGGDAFGERLGVKRTVHREYPYHRTAGLVSGEWFEVSSGAVSLDILFGETENQHTTGILMIEKEGETYAKSYWGQPQWPLFLTEWPRKIRLREMQGLKGFLEKEMQGSFSLQKKAVWSVKE